MVVSLVVGVAFSAAAPRLRQPLPAPPAPRVSTARPGFPRSRAAALDRHAAPPREAGPALFGRGIAPAPAVSLSSSARPCVPTPLAEAETARLSPPPTTDFARPECDCVCAGVGLSGGRGRLLTHVQRTSACTLNAAGLLPVSGCGDARVAPPCPTTLCVWRNLPTYLEHLSTG